MPEPNNKPFERLPKDVVPKHYDISIKPDLKKHSFEGNATITVQILVVTDKIVLNSLELVIPKAVFVDEHGNAHNATEVKLHKTDETATITFSKPLSPQTGTLSMDFKGELNDFLKGLYRSKYTTPNGDERYAAITQFEATDARRAFPCWDEPAIKATFDISLTVPKDRVALSNMNVISDTPIDDSTRLVKFATTPVMSTYLVALVVGEFDYVEGTSADGVQVRVYTPLGRKEQGNFALEVCVKTLPFYKEYFNVPYPLPKMDLIAVADFAAGAMENWGLVTYRETALLVDPLNTATINKQYVALTVGHELAHQWFGNLVTMEWWTHLWLNEGFASFIEFLCVHELFPHFDVWTQFVTNELMTGLQLDALKNSHPIEVPVGHPDEVNEIFDNISYNKGASVIRMLHDFLGDDCFRKGMNLYLTRHAYKNTWTEDLWKSLEECSDKPVGAIMSTWTKQKGFPVISVSSKQDGLNRVITLSQVKFNADGVSESQNQMWMIPIGMSTAADPKKITKQVLLDSKSTDFIFENVKKDHWIKLNLGAVGFYRVHYTEEMMAQILPSIKDQTLAPLDRLGLQDDLFAMVKAGCASTVDVLKLMEAYTMEDNYSVWSSISSCLGTLNTLLSHTDFQGIFHNYCRQLFSNIYDKLGWDAINGESHMDILLRSLVISRLGSAQDERVVAEAKKRFEAHANGTANLPADLRVPVYRTVAANLKDEKTFNAMMKLYRESDLLEEKNRIVRSLGAVTDEAHIQRVLEFAMSSEVRSQDSPLVIVSVSSTKQGRDLAWSFVQENKDELNSRYKAGFLVAMLVKSVTENFASEEKAQEVEAFFQKHPFPGTERNVRQSIETIRLNAKWLARDQEAIKTYLTNRQ